MQYWNIPLPGSRPALYIPTQTIPLSCWNTDLHSGPLCPLASITHLQPGSHMARARATWQADVRAEGWLVPRGFCQDRPPPRACSCHPCYTDLAEHAGHSLPACLMRGTGLGSPAQAAFPFCPGKSSVARGPPFSGWTPRSKSLFCNMVSHRTHSTATLLCLIIIPKLSLTRTVAGHLLSNVSQTLWKAGRKMGPQCECPLFPQLPSGHSLSRTFCPWVSGLHLNVATFASHGAYSYSH